MPWTSLCQIDELTEGEGHYCEVSGFKLAVFLSEGKVYVMDSYCPHAGGNMAGGYIEAGHAVCRWHHWAFDLQTGRLKTYPGVRIRMYPVRVQEREPEPALVQADLPIY